MKKSEINILIIDDDSSIRSVLTEAIKKFGYKATAVARPDEALSLVKIKTVNLALVDMMLPRMNGLDLVKEMRMTPFASNPVIFMSGIFRDNNFMEETVRNGKGLSYLVKPLDLKALKTLIDDAVTPMVSSSNQVSLQDLLTKSSSTARERAKAVESLEEISGYELPAILSVLMLEQSTGHLNLVDSQGDVFGITLQNGDIVVLDSATSRETLFKIIFDKGLMAQNELQALAPERLKGDVIKNLVEDSWISPHMSLELKAEQIKLELQKRINGDRVRLNYAEDRIRSKDDKVSFQQLLPLWHESAESVLPQEYLEDFYKELHEFPLKKGPRFKKDEKLLSLPMMLTCGRVLDLLDQNMTLEEIHRDTQLPLSNLIRVTHLLALSRWIVFADVRKENTVIDRFKSMEKIYQDLKDKNSFEVFEYFGAGADPKKSDVDRIFKEFAKANHPDLLPAQAPTEIKDYITRLFSLISEAHDVLMSDEKRKKFKEQQKQKEFEKQLKAESMIEEAQQSLQRSQFNEALEIFNKAYELYPTYKTQIFIAWAKVKKNKMPANVIKELVENLEKIPLEERRNAEYAHTMGLIKRSQGDMAGAVTQFEKALTLNKDFLESRRELAEMRAADANKKSFDLLNGDISSIVGSLFKKKSG